MKCVHSVVLSKINACVSGRKVVCTAVVNRLEKSAVFHAMIREGLGVIQVYADKAIFNASDDDSLVYLNLVRSSQEH